MLEYLKSIDWSGVGLTALFGIISVVAIVAIVPNLGKMPEFTKKGFDWLYAKAGTAKNVYVAGLLQRLTVLVRDVVLYMENTAVEDIKQKAADGKITKEEMLELLKGVKDRAITLCVDHIKLQGLFEVLSKVLFSTEDDLKKWLADHIETQVALLPSSGLQTLSPAQLALSASSPGMLIRPAIAVGLEKIAKAAEVQKALEAPKAAAPVVPPPAAG
jgi:hypothetical protein